ncbi:MAG TPA: ATP-binding protein [Accumulibacter sp.]|uniref:histidine kinase n=1 Tax=Candidatus Accumulibacter cognatus TaxID=2954383 RepID=A0A080MKZ9_9PROT|nr:MULTISPECIES: ATP-binding protein [Candidatus Accumulibacter]MCC2867852.1 CHASE domain-containing protein [Candidatus Accumulibacter phosphatis]KFB78264.1 MAG: Phytochrome-like protein cph1 [Candidatus Accumulibacter cognatus]MBL8401681.1 CHASE domain-containing protein [Accumulibacter sp.]MCM8581194.1 ATP-binding protein [Accumulibacter sp.]MCM8620555.1 ATP-binding protein [Accumulibacter sp.]
MTPPGSFRGSQRPESSKPGGKWLSRPAHVAILVFVSSVILAAGLIWRLEAYRLHQARHLAAILAAERAYTIQTSIDHVLSATYTLAAMLQQGKGVIPDFERTAGRLLRFYPGAAALQLAPGGVIQQVVPRAGNEQAIGHDLLHDPERDKEALRARDSGQLMLAGPFDLRQGGRGAAGRLPVFLDQEQGKETFWGFAIVLIAFPAALAPAQLHELPERGYAYELSRQHPDSGDKQVISASTIAPLDPVDRMLSVPNARWTLSIAPVAGWHAGSGLWWKSALALLLCLLLAWQTAWQAKLVAVSKEHERTLEQRVAQRTADLQRFAEVTAHHLQEPARRVASYAGRLRSQLAGRIDDDEVQASLSFISQQAARLQDLLRDVELYLAADQPRAKVESCAAEEILAALLAALAAPITEAGAKITVGPLPATLIDAPRLADLFRIALENALWHGRGEQPLRIDISGERLGEWVRYSISDNGPGVEEEYRRRVFRIFERLSSSSAGTGVGLAILRRISESAGGNAWLEENPGGGCRLVLELPAGDQPLPLVGSAV